MCKMDAVCAKGSITVEAVLVVPIVVMVMVSFMFSSFYLHDRVVCQTVLEKQTQRQEWIRKHPVDEETGQIQYSMLNDSVVLEDIIISGEEKGRLAQRVTEELAKGLWVGKVHDVSCGISIVSATAEAHITTKLPIPALLKYLGGFHTETVCTVKAPFQNPEELARAYTAVMKNDVKGE